MSAPSTKGNKQTGNSQSLTYTAISPISPIPRYHESGPMTLLPPGLNLGRPTKRLESSSRCSVPSTRMRRLSKLTPRFVLTPANCRRSFSVEIYVPSNASSFFKFPLHRLCAGTLRCKKRKTSTHRSIFCLSMRPVHPSPSCSWRRYTTHNNAAYFLKTGTIALCTGSIKETDVVTECIINR